VAATEGGDAERLVLGRRAIAPDPEAAQVEQPQGSGEHRLTARTTDEQVFEAGGAHLGKHGSEVQHSIELGHVPVRSPLVVVAVLAPALRVGADGLDGATGVGADSHVGPRRWDHQVAGTRQDLSARRAGRTSRRGARAGDEAAVGQGPSAWLPARQRGGNDPEQDGTSPRPGNGTDRRRTPAPRASQAGTFERWRPDGCDRGRGSRRGQSSGSGSSR